MIHLATVAILAALVAVTLMQKKTPGTGLRLAQVILLLLTALLMVTQIIGRFRPTGGMVMVPRLEEAACYRLGQLVGESPGDARTILVLRWSADTAKERRLAEAQDRGLREGLGDNAFNIVIESPEDKEAMENLQWPEDEEAMERLLSVPSGITPEEILAWLDRETDVAAIIMHLDPSGLLSPDLLKRIPPVYVKTEYLSPWLEELLEGGHLKGVVAPKPSMDPSDPVARKLSLDAVFENRFDLLTP